MFKEKWLIHTVYEWANFSGGPYFNRVGRFGMSIHKVLPGQILEIDIKSTSAELQRITTEHRHRRLLKHGTLLETVREEEDETDEA